MTKQKKTKPEKRKKSFLDQISESSPEAAEIAEEIRRERESDVTRDAPRTYLGCSDWRDAWLYVFKRASLHPTDFIGLKNGKVVCVVLWGREFNDGVVELLTKVAKRLPIDSDQSELRLIETSISDQGEGKLRVLFPKTVIKRYSDADRDAHPRLSYADPVKAKKMFPDAV